MVLPNDVSLAHRSQAGSSAPTSRAGSTSETRPFRGRCRPGPSSSSHFEATAALRQARDWKRRQAQCFRAKLSRTRARPPKRTFCTSAEAPAANSSEVTRHVRLHARSQAEPSTESPIASERRSPEETFRININQSHLPEY